MNWFKSKDKKNSDKAFPVTACQRPSFELYQSENRLSKYKLFDEMRKNIPIIDAALKKIIRLIGEFEIKSDDKFCENLLNRFLTDVKVNSCSFGINSFLEAYMGDLLTYGTAVGEMITDDDGFEFNALYNASLNDIVLCCKDNPLDVSVSVRNELGITKKLCKTDNILISALSPKSRSPYGVSILEGLPFMSELLMKIYKSIGLNWDRVGDLRFVVNYKPDENAYQSGHIKQRAKSLADEWSKAMNPQNGINDFVAVGDVDIRVIGADCPVLDSSVPVKQLLEQIVAKLGIPPFLLGLTWSTTERMSSQQADILTSELDFYRRILNPVIRRICSTYLHLNGLACDYSIDWSYVNLQDETELASARLSNARAEKIEQEVLLTKE